MSKPNLTPGNLGRKNIGFLGLYAAIAATDQADTGQIAFMRGRQSGKTLLMNEVVRKSGRHVVGIDCETGAIKPHKACACPQCSNPPRPCKKARQMARYREKKAEKFRVENL